MKQFGLITLAVGSLVLLPLNSFGANPNTYQVTGPILEVNDTFIAVQKGKERWEIARDTALKTTAELKVGDKVTITYTMKATKVEVKSGDSSKADAKASATPAASAAKK